MTSFALPFRSAADRFRNATDPTAFTFHHSDCSKYVSGVLYQIQTFCLADGMELNDWRLISEVHENKQTFVVLRAQVAHQVVFAFPLCFVAERMRLAGFLKNSRICTSRFHLGRPNPSR